MEGFDNLINESLAVALTAAILASGGGMPSSLLTAQPAQAASAQPEIDAAITQILAETNAERAKAGLEPLKLDATMSKVSQAWTQQMATNHSMTHNPSYTSQLPQPWISVGENVGQGYTQSTIVPAWMASPGHKSNILGRYSHIGLGYWADENGRAWFTQNFGFYNRPVLTTLNEPVTTVGKFDIKSSWLAKWDEIPQEYVSELHTSTGVLSQTKVTATPEVTFTGLNDNTTYTVKTTARIYNALGEVFTSPVKIYTVTTIEDLPTVTAPTNLTLQAGEDSIAATWTAPTEVYGTLAPYNVELVKGSTVVRTVQTTNPNFVFNGLTSNTDYKVNVIAASELKGKTATATAIQMQKTTLSSVADVTEPKNLVVTADSATSVKATWDAPDQKTGVGLKYLLTLSSAGKPDVTAQSTSASYTFAGVASETAYTVSVKAFIASENGGMEITTVGVTGAAATPVNYDGASASTPSMKPVLTEATKATLSWTAPSSVVGKLVDYTLTVKQQGQPERVFTTPLDYYVVTGLTENTAYTFELKANATSLNGKNAGSSTPATSTNTTPYAPSTAIASAPRALVATAVNYHQINASWTSPAYVVGTVIGYNVTIRSGDFHIETKTVTGLNTSFSNLPDSGYYTVEVSANAVSPDRTNIVTSALVDGSDVTPAFVDAPNAPTELRVTSSAYNEANLTWGTPEVYGMVWDYTVTLKESGKGDRVFTTDRNVFKITGLTENSSYTATVFANVLSANGQLRDTSPAASLGMTTPYGPSTVKVKAPSDLKFSGVTHNALTTSWTAPPGTVGSVTGYNVTLKQGATVIATKTVTTLAASFTGLDDSTDYTVEVSALAASADRTKTATSLTAGSTTLTLAYVATPNAPTGLKTTAVAYNEATLSWVAPTGIVGTLVGYTVTVKEPTKADRIFQSPGTSYTVTGLNENSSYTVQVAANVASRDGSMSETSPLTSVGLKTPYYLAGAVPRITGTAKVRSTLTANPGTWSPAPLTLTYQWYRSGTAILGATAATYTPAAADAAKTLTVRVTGSRTGYTALTKTSPATTAITTGSLTGAVPTITGTAKVRSTLTANPGTWSPAPLTLTYQWYRSGTAILGATAATYTPAAADAAKTLTVRVTGSRTGYTALTKTSPATTAITTGSLTGAVPTITGTAKVRSTLTANPGTWSPAPLTLTYQWYRSGTAILGATAATYTPAAADAAKTLTVRVTGSRTGYTALTKTSPATTAITTGSLTGAVPTITGTAKVGSTLTANPGTWSPAPLTLTYQWYRSGTAILGATAATYTPAAADAAKTLTVRVTGSRTGYTALTKTSPATTAITT